MRRRPGLRNLPRLWLAVVLLVLGSGTVFSGSIPPAEAASPAPLTWTQSSSVPQPATSTNNQLLAVTCPSASDCVAVGFENPNNLPPFLNMVLASTNGGGTWTAAPTVAQPATSSGVQQLYAVSCVSTSDCVAVGYYETGTAPNQVRNNEVLVTTDGGNTWTSATTVPQPGGSLGQNLDSVSCSSNGECVAVGYTGTANSAISQNEVLVSTDGGNTWGAASSVAQPGGSTYSQYLTGVSCPSASDCVAVGYNNTTSGYDVNEVLVSTNYGSTWLVASSVPQPDTSGSTYSGSQYLNGVSCASTSDCVAVGYYDNGNGENNMALVSTDGGTSWTSATSMLQPANALGGAGALSTQELYGVSCADTSVCVAVGYYFINSTSSYEYNQVLVSTDGGNTWTSATTVPQPGGSTNTSVALNAVSCASTNDCAAVGYYQSGTDYLNEAMLTAPTVTGISPTSALTGTNVTLSGGGFGTVTGSVYFTQGSTVDPVTGTSWSDTGASALVPTSLASGTVTVAVYNDTTGLLSNAVDLTVSQPPASVVASGTPSSVTANGTSYATVTATVYDANTQPVSGTTLTFSISSGPGTLATPTSVTTNVYGVATDTISSTTAGTATVNATTSTGVVGQATVTFTAVFRSTTTTTTTTPPTSTNTSASGSVGTTGGTVATLNNAMLLTVPAGAFSGPVNITATAEAPTAAPPPPSGCTAAAVWSFDTGGVEPTTPVTVTFSFSPTLLSSGLSASRLGVYYYDTGTASWSWVGGTVDTTNDTITVSLPHLSTYGVLVNTTVFNDLTGYGWASPSINALLGADVISGVSAGVFDPSGTVTRAQFATMLVSADELTPVASGLTPFSDVPATAAYAPYIAAAYNAGLILGVTPTSFEPNAPITRAQMAVILARLPNSSPASTAALTQFKDASAIARWAQPSIAAAVSSGLMNGFPDGTFQPTGTSTRAQAAVVVARYLTHIGKL